MRLVARWKDCDIYHHVGDITTLEVDAIVNAANPSLEPGGGVSGAIHRRAGPQIAEECKQALAGLGGKLATGEAVHTSAGSLPARYVIHTVGPVCSGTEGEQSEMHLAAAYRNCLALLRERGLRSIAFPCISTGHFGYPSHEALEIALRTVRQDIINYGGCERVVFCTFDMMDTYLYQRVSFERPESREGNMQQG
jgi:O-acetyl-ADP-ribose deacetylase (regulator of RNase III)